ncbi:protein I'm not dead yet-like isoform X2 [Plodia interpunctella]|uniref:protein I'm not dead yet-like isoform X2 n=1 Tax=Plodia interpunctella TaxID=58824 RepID=UPI002367E6D3|nr:protein I'm not dead yet-like isoform X2 [Plodia interpunctella]
MHSVLQNAKSLGKKYKIRCSEPTRFHNGVKMDSEPSESNLLIITKRDRLKLFIKLYWRSIVLIATPIILLPVAFIGVNNAYRCFYIFLISIVYWVTDVLHPSATSMVPIGFYSLIHMAKKEYVTQAYIKNELLDCLAIMIIGVAIEYSQINKRVALKILMLFGCSHYRLSFLLFFGTMILSMFVTDILACGLMMPLTKSILMELENMGILEMYETIAKAKQKSVYHEVKQLRPTDFTIFYFLGIAYSSSIGGMASIIGSHVNQIMKSYFELIFPYGPKIEFPHFMLLNLPGVLLQETLLYLWMNSYFLGMFRANSTIALEIGMSEEEVSYIKTLLAIQYQQLGKIKFHELIVGAVVILTSILQVSIIASQFRQTDHISLHSHIKTSAPCLIGIILLFAIPTRLNFLDFFKHRNGGSCFVFEALKDSFMTVEFEKFLFIFSSLYPTMFILVVIIFCKILTEFASNPCVVYCLMPSIARLRQKMDRSDWLSPPQLRFKSPQDLVRGNYYVCDLHFQSTDTDIKGKLNVDAVPSLNLTLQDVPNPSQMTQTDVPDCIRDAASLYDMLKFQPGPASKKSIKKDNIPYHKCVSNIIQQLGVFHNLFKDNYKHDRRFNLFALQLYFASPCVYRVLAKTLNLPIKRELQRMKFGIGTELHPNVLQCLSSKVSNLKQAEKDCVIYMGVIALKPNLYYHTKEDRIVGFHEIGGVQVAAPATATLSSWLEDYAPVGNNRLDTAFCQKTEIVKCSTSGWIISCGT